MDEEMTGADFTADIKKQKEGCKFYLRRAGVECPNDGRRRCDKCGWNPKVERQRVVTIRERMKADVR